MEIHLECTDLLFHRDMVTNSQSMQFSLQIMKIGLFELGLAMRMRNMRFMRIREGNKKNYIFSSLFLLRGGGVGGDVKNY